MENDAYVAYEGEFICEYYHSRSNSYYLFSFTDVEGQMITLTGDEADFYGMEDGNYFGRLVYGQNSEYLIELSVQGES